MNATQPIRGQESLYKLYKVDYFVYGIKCSKVNLNLTWTLRVCLFKGFSQSSKSGHPNSEINPETFMRKAFKKTYTTESNCQTYFDREVNTDNQKYYDLINPLENRTLLSPLQVHREKMFHSKYMLLPTWTLLNNI